MNIHVDNTIRGTVVAKAPAPNPKSPGKIKLNDGTILSAFAEKLALVHEGGSYVFGIVSNASTNGKTYLNIKTIEPLGAIADDPQFMTNPRAEPRQAAPAANGHANWHPAPPQTKPAEPARQQAPVAQPRQYGAAFPVEWNRPTHPRDGRRMFLTATLGKFIEAGRVNYCKADAMADAMVEILQAYDRVVGCEDPA
jgi:hypothetical protein